MYDTFDLKFWAGTEESFGVFLLCVKKMIDSGDANMAAGYGAGGGSAESDVQVPRLFSQSGNVGIIKIAGPLTNSDSPYNKYYGVTGYGEIRDAMIHAASQPDVGAIVLDIASGGGSVAGVFDTSKLISTIDKQVKPVHAFSSGGMMSAAYFLGSSARTVNADQMAEVGSIGVIAVHQEMSGMLKDMGITPTVLRSGKYKALGNPFEPLSKLGQEEMQAQLDHMYGIFVQHVADQRGVPYQAADAKMAQGKVFIGQQAKDAGLVDNITSFDALVSKVQGGIDSRNSSSKYGANSTNQNNKGIVVPKQALTEQQIAALAEGAAAVAEAAAAPGAAAAQPTAEEVAAAAAAQAAAAQAAAGAAAGGAATSAEAAAAAAAAAAAPAAASPTALEVVQGQLATAQAQVTELTIQLRDERAEHEKVKGSHASMRAIALASVKRLKVAMGQTAGGEEALGDAELLASHDALRTAFESKFKAGGVAAVNPADTEDKNKGSAVEDPIRAARRAATRPTASKK